MEGFKKINSLLLIGLMFFVPAVHADQKDINESLARASAAPAVNKGGNTDVKSLFSGSEVTGESAKPKQAAAGQTQLAREDYQIQAGDRIRIKIYPEDEYIKGSEMQVGTDGNITLPLVGKMAVAGKTVRDAEGNIAKIIDEDYLVNPEVVIEIIEYGKKAKSLVIVLGQVRKPGTYEFPPDKDRVTLLEVISMAGGFSEVANVKKIKIIRKQNGKKDVISANAEAIISGHQQDVELQSGDVVNVAESLF